MEALLHLLLLLLLPSFLMTFAAAQPGGDMTTEGSVHEAARLYPHMDASLQKAFYTCYRNNGKIATARLIASFVDPTAVAVARRVVKEANYDVPAAPMATNHDS